MKNKYLTLLAASSFAFFMQACGNDSSSASSDSDDEDDSVSTLFVMGSDYKTGEIRWIENDTLSEESIEIYQDTKLFAIGSQLFALERSGSDNIALIDTKEKKVSWEVALDDYSNPTDIVAASETEAWVALEGTDSFVKVSLKDGKIVKTVKTTDFMAEGGYSPNLADFEVSGDTLFAVFQRYVSNYDDDGNWAGTTYPNGLLAMYDLKDGELLDTIQLEGKNPMAVKAVKGNLYVASMGDYMSTDDCGIEKVNVSKKSSSMKIPAKDLGGGVAQMDVNYKTGEAFAVVYKGMDYETYASDAPAVVIDLAEGSAKEIKGIVDAQGGVLVDQASGLVYIGERTYGETAVFVYDGDKASKVESASDKALAPYNFAIVK